MAGETVSETSSDDIVKLTAEMVMLMLSTWTRKSVSTRLEPLYRSSERSSTIDVPVAFTVALVSVGGVLSTT